MEKMKVAVLIIAVLSTHCVSDPIEDISMEGPLMDVDNAISTREIDLTITSTSKKRDVSSEFDESVDILLDVEGEMVKKRFTRSPEYDDITMYDGDEKVKVKRNWAMYSAADGEGAIMVTRDTKNRLRTEGSIIHNDQYFFIQPTKDLRRHVLHRITPKRDVLELARPPRNAHKKQSMTKYVVELALVVDKGPMQKSEMIHTSLKNRKETAHQFLMKHLSLVMADVNVKYKSLSRYGTDISVRTNVFLRGKETPYSLKIPQNSVVRTSDLLRSFMSWARNQNYNHDTVMLLTGHVFQRKTTRGYAYVNGVCTNRGKYGIVNFGMGLQSTVYIAHELGHNLGMKHDQDSLLCSKQENYVMSSISGLKNYNPSASHPWKFTSCSNNYLNDVTSNKKTCLKTNAVQETPLNVNGQIWGYITIYDQLCSSMMKGATFCRHTQEIYPIHTICTRIFCGNGVTCKGYVPYDGTPCGKHKVCKSGMCQGGVSVDETCPYGDASTFTFGRAKITCSKAVEMSYCASKHVQKYCCSSCAKVKRSGHTCPYEDRADKFIRIRNGKASCTDIGRGTTHWCNALYIRESCCNKCSTIDAGCNDRNRNFHETGSTYTVQVRYQTLNCSCSSGLETCAELCIDRTGKIFSNSQGGCSDVRQGRFICNPYTKKVCCETCRDIKGNCTKALGCTDQRNRLHKHGSTYSVRVAGRWYQCSCSMGKQTCRAAGCTRQNRLNQNGDKYTLKSYYSTYNCSCSKGQEMCEALCVDRTDKFMTATERSNGQKRQSKQGCSYLRQRPHWCETRENSCCHTCRAMRAGCIDRNDHYHEDGTSYTMQVVSKMYRCSCSKGLQTCTEMCTDRTGKIVRVTGIGRRGCSYLKKQPKLCGGNIMKTCCETCKKIKATGCMDQQNNLHIHGSTYNVWVYPKTFRCSCSKGRQTCQELCIDRTGKFFKNNRKGCRDVQQGEYPCDAIMEKACCKTCKDIKAVGCMDQESRFHRNGTRYEVWLDGKGHNCSCSMSHQTCEAAGCTDLERRFHDHGTTYNVTVGNLIHECSCSMGHQTCLELCTDYTGKILTVVRGRNRSKKGCNYLWKQPRWCKRLQKLCCHTCKAIKGKHRG